MKLPAMWPFFSLFCEDTCGACQGRVHGGPDLQAWLCEDCLADVPPGVTPLRRSPEGLAGAYALGAYGGPVGALVRLGKYRPAEAALLAIGERLAASLPALPIDHLVATPTPPWRRLRRGFNAAELLAAPLSRHLGLPLVDALRRRHGTPQARLDRAERTALSGQVHLRRALSGNVLSGNVLLVDDVVTTGSTARACAGVLLQGGARNVWLLTAASAVRST